MPPLSNSMHEVLVTFGTLPDLARVRLPVVAALYGCHPSTVRRRVETGDIPKPEKRGRVLSWRVGDLRRDLGA